MSSRTPSTWKGAALLLVHSSVTPSLAQEATSSPAEPPSQGEAQPQKDEPAREKSGGSMVGSEPTTTSPEEQDGEKAASAESEPGKPSPPPDSTPDQTDEAATGPAPEPAGSKPIPSPTPKRTVELGEAKEGNEPVVDGQYHGATDQALVKDADPPAKMSFDVMLDLTVPLGRTADFVSQAGLQGFAVSFRYYVTDEIAVGAGAAFDGLSKKEDSTTNYDNLTITGVHTKQISFTPLLAKGFYAFRGEGQFEPYIALGLGAALSSQRFVTGYSAFSENHWHFATAPEVGTHFDIGQLVLVGAAKFTYLPPSGGSVAHTFVNVSLGVAIQ